MKKLLAGIALILFALNSYAFTLPLNQANGPASGIWFKPANPGWGMSIQQQYETIFVQLYTYKPDGSPIWYIMVCKVSDNTCGGDLKVAVGGDQLPYYREPTVAWAGTMTLIFDSNDSAFFMFKINGSAAWSEYIVKFVFDNTAPQ